MTNYQKRKEKNDEYRSKIMRFTFQLSLGDGEARDWFEQQPEKGAYLKKLILRDKAEQLGYGNRKVQNLTKPVTTRSYSPFVWVGAFCLWGSIQRTKSI